MLRIGIKTIEKLFKRSLTPIFDLFLKRGDPDKIPLAPETVTSLLILRPDKLGDMIVTIPVIHEIKRLFPHMRVEVVASPRNAVVINDDPAVDEVHLYVKNIFKDWPLIRRLKRRRFEVVFDAVCLDSITGLLLAKLIGARTGLVASRKGDHRKYYDYCRPYQAPDGDHNLDNGLLLFDAFGVDRERLNPYSPPYIPESSLRIARGFFDRIAGDKFIVGINISAGSRTRTLPPSRYIETISGLAAKVDRAVFVVSSVMADRREAGYIRDRCAAEVHLIPENLTLADVFAIISRLHLFVSPDTSLLHAARLMQIPVVGLYSGDRRNFNAWRPYGQSCGAVKSSRRTDIFDITPQQIVAEFKKVYDSIVISTSGGRSL